MAAKKVNPNVDAVAKAVIRGDYGVGQARKEALGSQYAVVQARVNQILAANRPASRPAPAPTPAPPPQATGVSQSLTVNANEETGDTQDTPVYSPPSPFNDQYQSALLEQQRQALEQQRAQNRESAYQIIQDVLANYGLGELSQFVNDIVFKEDVVSADVILGRVRQTKEYKQRFAANEQRRAKGLNVLSESEYVAMERVYMQYFRQSGLPKEMFDENTDVQMLLANDVSVAELAQRVNQGYEAVRNSDPQIVNEMRRIYGVTDDQLAAYFLDPEKATPILLRQAQAAQIAGQARLQAGFELGMGQAEELAVAGVTQEQAREGFQAIQAAEELFQTLTGEQEITQQEQISGVFATNAAAQQRIRQRQRGRQAQFEQGGRFAGQGSTFTGLQ